MAAKLRAYLSTKASEPFDWRRNNCLSFVSGALEALELEPLPSDWCEGYSTMRGAAHYYRRTLKRYGLHGIIDALDVRYDRTLTLHPQEGLVCARPEVGPMGYAFGVTSAQGCVFLTEAGARWTEPRVGDVYWVPE